MSSRLLKFLLATVMIGLALLIAWNFIMAFGFGWQWADWTGFGSYTNPRGELQRGKTLWDWMDLLLIPTLLALGVWWLDRSGKNSERKITDDRIGVDRQLAADRRHQEILDTYIDRMTELMLKEGLQSSDRDSQVREIARARTLLALQSIDAKRKGLLLRFLYDADLIKNPESLQTNTTEDQAGLLACIIRLEGADLGGVDLSGLDLKCINLIGVNLEGANFFAANLQDAMLAKAKLDNANLGGAAMVRAKLEGASLRHTYLHGAFFMFANAVNADFTEATAVSAKFHDADLRHTRFDGALLSGSDLRRTNLSSASLIEANLLEYEAKFPTPRNFGKEKTYSVIGPTAVVGFKVGPANIDESDLSHAILIRAKISPTQLSRAKSLSGTWMPDSTIHEEKPILVTEVVNTQTDTESGKRTESDAGRVGVAVDAGASIPGGEHRTHKADLDQPH